MAWEALVIASRRYAVTEGTAMAASIAIIAMTTINSARLKPSLFVPARAAFCPGCATLIAYQLVMSIESKYSRSLPGAISRKLS